MALLDDIKVACRVPAATTAFNGELTDLISAALDDLGLTDIKNSVLVSNNPEPLIKRAVVTYCKMHFGFQSNDYFERLKASYDEQKAQLLMASGYTDWGDA